MKMNAKQLAAMARTEYARRMVGNLNDPEQDLRENLINFGVNGGLSKSDATNAVEDAEYETTLQVVKALGENKSHF